RSGDGGASMRPCASIEKAAKEEKMWTSSYLPRRSTLVRGGLLLCAALLLLGLGLHARRCPLGQPPTLQVPHERPTARLRVDGTPGACVRIDGQIVGPIPAEVALQVTGPRRLVVQACKRGHLDAAVEVDLEPGQELDAQLWLPRYQLIRGEGPSPYAPRP